MNEFPNRSEQNINEDIDTARRWMNMAVRRKEKSFWSAFNELAVHCMEHSSDQRYWGDFVYLLTDP